MKAAVHKIDDRAWCTFKANCSRALPSSFILEKRPLSKSSMATTAGDIAIPKVKPFRNRDNLNNAAEIAAYAAARKERSTRCPSTIQLELLVIIWTETARVPVSQDYDLTHSSGTPPVAFQMHICLCTSKELYYVGTTLLFRNNSAVSGKL